MSRLWFLAVAVLFVGVILTSCFDEEKQKYKLAYEVTKAIDCIPWQFNEGEELCLCFGEAKAFSVFAFLGPDHLCFEVDERGEVVYDPEGETSSET
jgi:hypothetical protein